MQTFLPLPDFHDSARYLDDRRLGKQRVECKQIILAIERSEHQSSSVGVPWANHPATRMWRGFETALNYYGLVITNEWIARGFRDSLHPFFKERLLQALGSPLTGIWGKLVLPPWYRKKAVLEALCASHRSNLLRKDFSWYGQFGWLESDDMDYYWPV